MIKESVKEATRKAMAEARVDIDIEYCKQHGIKFNNHEKDASTVDLFNTASNMAAFERVFKATTKK